MKQAKRIDFSGRRHFLADHAEAGVLCMAIVLCGAMGYQWHQARQHLLSLKAIHDAMDVQHAARPSPRDTKVALPPAQAVALNQAIGKLNLPWTELFNALSAAMPREVAVLSISPDSTRQEARITAETDKVDNMIHCVQALKKRPEFEAVRLMRSQIDEKDAMHPLRFELQLRWHQLEKDTP